MDDDDGQLNVISFFQRVKNSLIWILVSGDGNGNGIIEDDDDDDDMFGEADDEVDTLLLLRFILVVLFGLEVEDDVEEEDKDRPMMDFGNEELLLLYVLHCFSNRIPRRTDTFWTSNETDESIGTCADDDDDDGDLANIRTTASTTQAKWFVDSVTL